MQAEPEIGIAFLNAAGIEVGSSGGCLNTQVAADEARRLLVQAYPQAARAVIYRGRTRAEGTDLSEVTR